MEKNTLVAIILCVVVITAGYFVQVVFFPVEEPPKIQLEESAAAEEPTVPGESLSPVQTTASVYETDSTAYQDIEIETDVFSAVFTTKGGSAKSIKLKHHKESDGQPLDMIHREESKLNAFDLYFGDINSRPLDAAFNYKKYNKGNDTVLEFWKELDMTMGSGVRIPVEIRKKYLFKPDEYVVELEVQLTNKAGKAVQFNYNGFAYSLGFGPQIGPNYEKLDGKYDFRKYITFNGEKKKEVKLPKPDTKEVDARTSWSAISGKYFAVIGITDATQYKTVFSSIDLPGLEDSSRMFFSRPAFKSANVIDTFRFYIGPKSSNELRRYDEAETNGFGMTKMELDRVLDSGAILGWLQQLLKWLLLAFYNLIPNYGVAIILLTVVVKIVLYPLTKKSFESSAKMAALSPKMKEIQAKYKGNQQKMNSELSALYKKEGVNPMSGCLPILLQMPIFFALYGLLNSFFELRGSGFMEPWITDLSQPDSIFNFAPTSYFFIGSDIRLLPILMAGTQIISSMLMQPAAGATGGSGGQLNQMKMMTYAMPVVFLFVLYDVSSGLLLYWTMTNIISIGQQLWINYRSKKKAEAKG